MATRLMPPAGALLRIGAGAALLLCCWSSALTAQELRLRPYVDLSLPTAISIQNGQLHVRQRFGMAVGARLIVSFNQRLDAVTGVSYSPGYAIVHGAGSRFGVTTGSHVLTATAAARYWVRPPARMLSWEVHTGVGLVFGGEPAYRDLFERSTLSGIVGTTVRYQIGRVVGLRLQVQDRLYRVRFGKLGAGGSRSPLQLSFGLDLPFHRPAS